MIDASMVGKPLSVLLKRPATVTICHTCTKDSSLLPAGEAEIPVAAAGKREDGHWWTR
ncbi:MAG: hypothetical protein ACLTLQ_08355 [[Clostridium] scindens]